MYRRAFQSSARQFNQIDDNTRRAAGVVQFFKSVSETLMNHAWRENRRYDRAVKNKNKSVRYLETGLNGPRAMERRRRQIVEGHLKVANGLVMD